MIDKLWPDLQKAKRDTSKLVRVKIIDKNGKVTTVLKSPEEAAKIKKDQARRKKIGKMASKKDKKQLWKERVSSIKDAIREVLDSTLSTMAQRNPEEEVQNAIDEQRMNAEKRKGLKESSKSRKDKIMKYNRPKRQKQEDQKQEDQGQPKIKEENIFLDEIVNFHEGKNK